MRPLDRARFADRSAIPKVCSEYNDGHDDDRKRKKPSDPSESDSRARGEINSTCLAIWSGIISHRLAATTSLWHCAKDYLVSSRRPQLGRHATHFSLSSPILESRQRPTQARFRSRMQGDHARVGNRRARLHGRMVERKKPIVHGHTTVSTTRIPVPSVSNEQLHENQQRALSSAVRAADS